MEAPRPREKRDVFALPGDAVRTESLPFMRILDRYVLRSFLEPFLLCFAGFLGILIIFDLFDNSNDFIAGKSRILLIGVYYAHQLPHFILLCMPVGVLLALLYSLSKLSRSNEIISMLTAGRSVPRILIPLFIFCAGITALCTWLNYELAPRADAARREDIGRIRFGEGEMEKWKFVVGHLSKDRMTNRLWFSSVMRPNVDALDEVHITQLDSLGQPINRWYAREAAYNARTGDWILTQGKQIGFDGEGNIAGPSEDWTRSFGTESVRAIGGWSETPFRIASSRMDAEQLSVPDLREYLASNADFPDPQLAAFRTHFHHRWALPFTCFAVAFIAAPLGIVFSRRAVLASVAASIFIFFIFLFLMFFFLALGKGNHVSPVVAAWTPNAALVVIGSYLLYLRSTNREAFQFFSRKK
jgi:lipopolysaccharide export system permease protein